MLRLNCTSANRSLSWTLLQTAVCIILLQTARTTLAQQPLEITNNLLELPSSRQALNSFANPAVVTFEKRPLAECLENLSEYYKVPIWIDRRVDRSRLISILGMGAKELPDANTILGCIRTVAKLGGAEAGLIENVVYVGPPDQFASVQFSAVRLHNEIMNARKGPAGDVRVDSKSLTWNELATPSELLQLVEQQWSVRVDATLPHDLMHAGKLPASTLATQLTLLLAGFGQQATCRSPTEFTVSELTNDSVWKSEYSAKEIQTNRYSAAKLEFPQSSMQVKNGACTVTGPTAFHLKLLAVRAPITRRIEPKFTLGEVRGPLEQIVGGLGKHLSLEVKWSESIPTAKKQTVITFGVSKAKTPDEILAQLGQESGLSIQRQGETINVSP